MGGSPATLGNSAVIGTPGAFGTIGTSGTLKTSVGVTNTKTVKVKSGSRNTISIQQQLPNIRQVKTQTLKLSSTKPRELVSVKIESQAIASSNAYGTRIVPRTRSFSV